MEKEHGIALKLMDFSSSCLLAFVSSFAWFMVSVLLWTAGEVLCLPNAKAYVAESTANRYPGRGNMLLDLSMESGYGLGPMAAGLVLTAKSTGAERVWVMLVVVALFFTLGLGLLARKPRRASVADDAFEHSLDGSH